MLSKLNVKTAQSWSIEMYIVIVIFLTAIIFFYYITTSSSEANTLKTAAEDAPQAIKSKNMFSDNKLTQDEMQRLSQMNCSEIRRVLGVGDKKVCIYFTTSDQKILNISNGTDTKFGFGCPGIIISSKPCGS